MRAIVSIPALSVRDREVYSLLFEAVGLSVLQFKTLISSEALDWLEYAPNEVVELNGENMYFLYSGEDSVDAAKSIDNSDHTISDKEALHVSNMVFDDVQFAKTLKTFLNKNIKKKNKSSSVVGSSFIVGPNGASMMRISTSKLLRLMKNDDELSSSVQRLVLQCMQEKLCRTL